MTTVDLADRLIERLDIIKNFGRTSQSIISITIIHNTNPIKKYSASYTQFWIEISINPML